ncbi:hypothetical protein CK228_13525 [Mesorhizobium sp. WSM4312]|uniref:helix-turn-helix domain-containing protein n=1 Tax=Mesorhizobium sp. WSM4312 TaxID=2029411 RepID=UPI000BAE9338|nr:helix-turn-helix domain-containing protein [Mesorhizobium sp. WSM4312]PBB68125.1 hypothetical protein CK228_13525 [Mesorhizobium sp. WSM4312]
MIRFVCNQPNLQQLSRETIMNKFRIGQKVRITNTLFVNGKGGKGFSFGDVVEIIELDRTGHWPIHAKTADGSTGLLGYNEVDAVEEPAKEPTAPMAKAVLDLLRRKGAITSLEAQGVLRCRQLPARVLDLKRLGHKIVTEMKMDPTGQKYARYHLQAA